MTVILNADYSNKKSEGISANLKLIHVLDANKNGFDPQTGSTVGLNLKYKTKNFYGLQANVGFHHLRDTSLTDSDKKIASGLFLTHDFSSKTVLDEANIVYNINDSIAIKIGRRHPPEARPAYISNPIAMFKISQVENSYEALSLRVKLSDKSLVALSQIDKMMPGSRSTADYALIGEYTNSAGIAINPSQLKGEFVDIEQLAFKNGTDKNGNNVDTKGITMFSFVDRTFSDATIQLWNYYAHDIVNYLNLQVDRKIILYDIDSVVKLQYLKEDDIGDSLTGNVDASLYGIMGMFKISPLSFSVAFTKTEGEFFNPWGFDAGFTSSMFSRNEYRDDVNAYKIGVKYNLNKKFKISVSYANYGKSKSFGGNIERSLYPSRDAMELDTVISYKPTKNLLFKLLNVYRESEYVSSLSDRKQNQSRLIAEYNF